MARLSSKTGDYSQTGTIIDRQLLTNQLGNFEFDLTFITGSEEVYLNGSRLMRGANADYTTSVGKITLNEPVSSNSHTLELVGRASTNEIPFSKSSGESVVLLSGQTAITFSTIEVDPIEIYVNGPLIDRGRLTSPQDYSIREGSLDTIDLNHTFPEGTVLEGIQGTRLGWVDADNLIVNDGTSSKSLSRRFQETQDSVSFFTQTNGVQLQEISVGLVLSKWSIEPITGAPELDVTGTYPVLLSGKSYWNPNIAGSSPEYTVSTWEIVGDRMDIQALASDTGMLTEITYVRRVSANTSDTGSIVDYGLITGAIYDQEDDGGL